MKNTACDQLLNIETISSAFQNNKTFLSEQIVSCFYTCYQFTFIKWAKITYQHYPSEIIEFAANSAFTDAVLALRESASRGELYQGNASVKTVLFQYCRYKLLGYLKDEERLAEKNKKLIRHFSDNSNSTIDTVYEFKERSYQSIMRALAEMPDADRQIIQWRHIEEKSIDEIARLLAIKVTSATNRIYRCMQRLRELVEEMNKGGDT
ncbi:MAG TPA: sigma-70 family RNA polymerase sigma factor [Agriterribacter sp.]|nr:sigma-70 family RNA polymerase sigma factor [Chitinophagaceae bacterium]HRP31863.1 sigma-70 family RNA polymerase sigma factor [Agriterribacter sp.]